MAAELSDLESALKRRKMPPAEREKLKAEYGAVRESFQKQIEAMRAWENFNEYDWDAENLVSRPKPKPPQPKWIEITMPAGVPEEFVEYFRGSMEYQRGDTNEARRVWQELLARPANERHFRSTWAAYMLGRSCPPEEWEKAVGYYAQTRALAKQGFADSLGLAAASVGWEAQADLKQQQFERAIELYLEQYASGDPTAVQSLRFAARDALQAGPEQLAALAKNPRVQRVITSFVIARARWDEWNTPDRENAVKLWLAAVESAGVKDVDSAEKLALAAYQNGQMDVAQRWVDNAKSSPVARWLQAKLLLRDGKVDRAAALLSRIAREFPVEERGTNEPAPTSLRDTVYLAFSGNYPEQRTAGSQILGELGTLKLARKDYVESLDALLRSGYWLDAAYVAERVLTVDELKSYVDREWPAGETPAKSDNNTGDANYASDAAATTNDQRRQIRYLLGRRLTRESRGMQARAYYPEKYLEQYDALMRTLNIGRDESLPTETRADALFEAAKLARHDGMELFSTEVAPDWHAESGDFELELTGGNRATNNAGGVVLPSADELARNMRHRADPEARFHYRYQAAFIAMEAAQLLPNNSDVTARILCTAGAWLKARDPKTADIFYKALVRRCRKTALGAEADRRRWFPELDAQGNLVPRQAAPPMPAEPAPMGTETEPAMPPEPPATEELPQPMVEPE